MGENKRGEGEMGERGHKRRESERMLVGKGTTCGKRGTGKWRFEEEDELWRIREERKDEEEKKVGMRRAQGGRKGGGEESEKGKMGEKSGKRKG